MCPPHTPIVPAADFIGRSGGRDVVQQDPLYSDWLYQGDAMLGELLATLDRHGLAKDTLVIATSDNGAAGRAYPPLRDSKASIYEGGHRVPFVVRWPGKVQPASLSRRTICLTDCLATTAEILGADLPEEAGEDSLSFADELLGRPAGAVRDGLLHQSHRGDLAIRQGPWKLILLTNGKRELYNLEEDLGETKDVILQNEQVAERLSRLLQEQHDLGRSRPGMPQRNDIDFLSLSPRSR